MEGEVDEAVLEGVFLPGWQEDTRVVSTSTLRTTHEFEFLPYTPLHELPIWTRGFALGFYSTTTITTTSDLHRIA